MTLKFETSILRTNIPIVRRYYRHGDYHREDGPAIVWYVNDITWWKYGEKIKKHPTMGK